VIRSRLPYLRGAYVVPERIVDPKQFPCSLHYVPTLDVELGTVTFFVGENGSGKSTLLEALAELSGVPPTGGGKNELADPRIKHADLAQFLRPKFAHKPQDVYFFRGETTYNFAELLEERQRDPDFLGDPYVTYGGQSLHTRSHGESYLAVMDNRIDAQRGGLFFLDEPESALSPRRQVELLRLLDERVRHGKTQLVIATHSPILLTWPGAMIRSFDDPKLPVVRFEETEHWRVTRAVLGDPAALWRELRPPTTREST
jgi:predicted ATPase